MPDDQRVVLIERNLSVGPIGLGFEDGLVEINGEPHAIHSITFALETPSIAPVDVGVKSITFNEGYGIEDLRAIGGFVEGYAGMGRGVLLNDDGDQIGTYVGVRSNYAAAIGMSVTWLREAVEFNQNSSFYRDMTTAPCFPAGTQIAVVGEQSLSIENVRTGFGVLAFPELGRTDSIGNDAVNAELVAGKVVQTFNNITEEWIELHFTDPRTGKAASLTVTPGHVMLTPGGGYKQRVQMIEAQSDAPSLDTLTDAQRLGHYAGAVKLVSADSQRAQGTAQHHAPDLNRL